MGKHIHPCELGGSLYEKRNGADIVGSLKKKHTHAVRFVDDYNKFYRNQVDVMRRLFDKDR